MNNISKIHGQVSPKARKASGVQSKAFAHLSVFGWDCGSNGKPTAPAICEDLDNQCAVMPREKLAKT